MSTTCGSPSPQCGCKEPVPDSKPKHECKATQKAASATQRKLSTEAAQRKLEYNRNYMAKKRANTRAKLKKIKRWILEEPEMFDPLRQMEILKKLINE